MVQFSVLEKAIHASNPKNSNSKFSRSSQSQWLDHTLMRIMSLNQKAGLKNLHLKFK